MGMIPVLPDTTVVVADRTAPDRPITFSIERYRNENIVVLSGHEVFSSLAVYRSCDDGTTLSYTPQSVRQGRGRCLFHSLQVVIVSITLLLQILEVT